MAMTSELPKFCKTCGQEVKGKTAAAAANPMVVYCCESGDKLESNGTCPNPNCPYYKQIPNCT